MYIKIIGTFILSITLFSTVVFGQNIFPFKTENCTVGTFCLDCGDDKASYDIQKFEKIITSLNDNNNLKGIVADIYFQVLIDSLGRGCVLSHTDKENHQLTRFIVARLNGFNGWIPAKTEGNKEELSSIVIVVNIKNGKLSGHKRSVNYKFDENRNVDEDRKVQGSLLSKATTTEIKMYKFTTWDRLNLKRSMPISRFAAVDKLNRLWFSSIDSIYRSKNNGFESTKLKQNINPDIDKLYGILIDNNGVKWFVCFKKNMKVTILSYDEQLNITDHTSKLPMMNFLFDFSYSPKSNKIIVTHDNGILIHQNGKWKSLNHIDIKSSADNKFYFAREDYLGRLWIGTGNGTYLISEKGVVTNFNSFSNALNEMRVNAMSSDSLGNVYLGYKEKYKKEVDGKEAKAGVLLYDNKGNFKSLTSNQLNLRGNDISSLAYNSKENVLWMSGKGVGLKSYDITKNKWISYSASDIQTSNPLVVSNIILDKANNIYLISDLSIVKVEKVRN